MGTISWKMSNNFINKDSISSQLLSLKGSTTFKHPHIKLRQHYKKCLLLIKVEHRTFESTLAASQLVPALSAQARQPTRPQTFNESFYHCHLIPQKVNVASVERGVVVSERKAPAAPVFESPESKQPPPPTPTPVGSKLQSYVACWCACCHDEWTHIKRSNYLEASKHTPVWGDKERFCQRAISHVAFKKHHQECALYRYVFTGKWQETPLNTNSGILKRGLFVRQFNLRMKSRDIWWHSWLLLLISVGGI